MLDRVTSNACGVCAAVAASPRSHRWPRRLVLASLVIGLPAHAAAGAAQEIEIRVDPRVELFSVLFQMAGRDEYNMTRTPRWQASVDTHFAPFAGHAAVRMTERLAGSYRVGFFVPMNLAIHVTDPPELAERVPLESASSVHRTWTTYPDSTRAYLALVRDFARASRFAEFLAAHAALIDSTEIRLRRLVADDIDLSWFDDFWGTDAGSDFVLVPGLTNGAASYGVDFERPGSRAELYAITGVTAVDSVGFPYFDAEFSLIVVHEFNHSYANPLIDEHRDDFGVFADSLYVPVAQRMRRQGYGSWESMLYESLVRAAVIRYLARSEGEPAAQREIEEQTKLGFVWIEGLSELLADYERNRDTYPSMRQFMPRVVSYFRAVVPTLRERVGG